MRDGSRHWAGLDYAALDFETTGLDPDLDEVVSAGVVPIASGRIDLSRAAYLTAPPGRAVGRAAVPVHGLRPVDLVGSPGRDQLVKRLTGELQGRRVLAWSAWIEAMFLSSLLGESGRSWRSWIIDVRELILHLDHLSGTRTPETESLVACAARHGVPPARAHHALGDALMTAELFLVVAGRLESRGVSRIRDLQRLGSGRRRR